jgi:AsmA family/AsmA-like C-terminal region
VLNRLFIAIGVLVILTMTTAFLVPRFIQWSDYRPRLEGMASAAFGTKVSIEGDIALTLLPQPQLHFTNVKMGSPDAPVVQIADVEAQFSLLDFLRDQYKVTRLTIDHPVVNATVAADGTLNSGLAITETGSEPNVSVADAEVVDGAIHVSDARTAKTYAIENIDGHLTLDAIRGPFSFEGQTKVNDAPYAVHAGLGSLDAAGGPVLSLFIQSLNDRSTLQTDGTLQAGPKYIGTLKYRQSPPSGKKGDTVDAGRGDFTLEGKLDAATDRVLLSDYTALPDENRPTTRLTGAAELKLGKDLSFNAVISGGVVVLPPRDATAELSDPPYELVRLLGEVPMPPIPPIAGTIGLDVSELNLRAVSLRDLRLDAETDGKGWTVKSFSANLPGGTALGLSGALVPATGHPAFAGNVSITTKQLDRLAALWRKPPADDPLFDMPGSLTANVTLSGSTLTVSGGRVAIDDTTHAFTAEIGYGTPRTLNLTAQLGVLSSDDSAALAALMPEVAANGSFGATFPKGEIDLSADRASVFGLDGQGLVVNAAWDGGVLEFSKLAGDVGGATFDTKATAFGTLVKPELSGSGSIKITEGSKALAQILDAVHAPGPVVAFLGHSLPADLTFKLDAPAGNGGQAIAIVGTLDGADTKLSATLSAGVVNALKAPISASLEMTSPSPHLLVAQLGLGDAPLFEENMPLKLSASVDGVPSNSYETHVTLSNGADHVGFAGNVVPGDFTSVVGGGDIDVALSDPSALAEALGAGGVYLPAVTAKARLQFTGLDSFKASAIDAGGITGDLTLTRIDGKASVTGALMTPAFDLQTLLPFLIGPSGTLTSSANLWPDGPIDVGVASRGGEGRIDVKTPAISAGPVSLSDASFGLDWSAQGIHLRDLSGKAGGGSVRLDATICCSGTTIATKQINGRIALDGVALDSLAPAPIAAGMDGTILSTAAFSGGGATLAEAVASMTGTGSYTISNFSATHFDPALFSGLGSLTDILDMEPDVLTATVNDKLGAGPFTASTLTGGFTIAGGVLRSPNLAIDGPGARIFGSGSLSLSSLVLDGRYSMTPTTTPDAASPLDPNTAEVSATVAGPLWAPTVDYDVAELVEGMKIKASEAELAILEQRKADADARAKAQVEADAKLAAQRQADAVAIVAQQAVEAAANAAADTAAKQAAVEAAALKATAAAAAATAASSSSSSAAATDTGL